MCTDLNRIIGCLCPGLSPLVSELLANKSSRYTYLFLPTGTTEGSVDCVIKAAYPLGQWGLKLAMDSGTLKNVQEQVFYLPLVSCNRLQVSVFPLKTCPSKPTFPNQIAFDLDLASAYKPVFILGSLWLCLQLPVAFLPASLLWEMSPGSTIIQPVSRAP